MEKGDTEEKERMIYPEMETSKRMKIVCKRYMGNTQGR